VPTLARVTLFHSRAIAPTRRVALGDCDLPVDPAPGFGGILLGGMVAAHIADIDPDLHPDLMRLTVQLEEGRRVPQPRLRYRFQNDRVGLSRSEFDLVGKGEHLRFDFDDRCTPAQAVLGAVYAAGKLEPTPRRIVMGVVRRAMRWGGPVGPELIASLAGFGTTPLSVSAFEDPIGWAMDTLGFDPPDRPKANGNGTPVPARSDVLRRFRRMLREVHPDHGANAEGAAQRISDLTEARRILLGR
jgi:hypothetical protein